jgi:hypothetical protein
MKKIYKQNNLINLRMSNRKIKLKLNNIPSINIQYIIFKFQILLKGRIHTRLKVLIIKCLKIHLIILKVLKLSYLNKDSSVENVNLLRFTFQIKFLIPLYLIKATKLAKII